MHDCRAATVVALKMDLLEQVPEILVCSFLEEVTNYSIISKPLHEKPMNVQLVVCVRVGTP